MRQFHAWGHHTLESIIRCNSAAGRLAQGGETREIVERLVTGLKVVGIQLLLVEQNRRQPALIILGRVRLQWRGGEENGGVEMRAVQRVGLGDAARDSETETSV